MSYDGEKMDSLRIELKNLRGLVKTLETFNENIYVFEKLASAIEKSNELKEQELAQQGTKKLQKKM